MLRKVGVFLFLVYPGKTVAQVIITELSATSNERVFHRNADDIAQLNSGTQWWEKDYEENFWKMGSTPIGFGYPDIVTDVSSEIQNITPTLYLRQSFNLSAVQAISDQVLNLQMDYDDSFIAYLNGREVARADAAAPGSPHFASQVSYNSNTADSIGTTFVIGTAGDYLNEGLNTLAIEIHNESLESGDLKAKTKLFTTSDTYLEVGDDCTWFPGLIVPSGGVFDPALLAINPKFSDWIELHNPSGSEVDISGWGLSDDASNPAKSIFPNGTTIPSGGYLLVLADELDAFNDVADYFHAPFKLSKDGEDMVLTNEHGLVQSFIPGGFPTQYSRQSYGWDPINAIWGYFDKPTPCKANGPVTLSDRVDAPDFSPDGGFFDNAVTLTLSTETPGASIRYTTDGTEPTATTGQVYTSPILLPAIDNKTGHVIKAKAFKSGLIESKAKSRTYLISQDSRLKNVPALIFTADENETFTLDHGVMSIKGGTYLNEMWVENGPTSYNIPLKRGPEYERPLFLEYYQSDGLLNFREPAGVRLAASDFSRPRLILDDTDASPWANNPMQKPSFNLYFRDDYGNPELQSNWIEHRYDSGIYTKLPAYLLGGRYPVNAFKQLRIRAGKNDMQNPFVVDEVVRRMFVQMGQKGSVGRINTLYVNGEYKGFFNMCERLREPFMQAHHGGNGEWDVRQVDEYANGDDIAWNEMMSILQRSGAGELSLADWQEALAYLDPVNLADYFLLNIYGATYDWPQNNWVAARERSAEGRYRLYVWDAEGSYQNQGYFYSVSHNSFADDLLARSDTLSTFFQLLLKSPEWRLIFADRINKHMFHDGVLDHRNRADSIFRQHLLALKEDYEPLLDFGFGQSVNLGFYSSWSSATTGRRRYLFGNEGAPAQVGDRTDFSDNGLWPAVAAPVFSIHGGDVPVGFPVSISAAGGTQIYYTEDGTDPREMGGAIQVGLSPYSGALTFDPGRTIVKARAFDSDTSSWSALTEVEFVVDLSVPSGSNLVISEFMYHPAGPSATEAAAGYNDQDDFEFIEIMNTSPTDTIDLTKLSFTGGVSFDFAGSTVSELGPGERAIVVSNQEAFAMRYAGVSHPVAGQYSGGFSNNSEAITLMVNDPTPTVVQSFVYDDEAPWPQCGDGLGYSLLLISPDSNPDHSDPLNWECSKEFGGSLNGSPLNFDYQTWADFNFSALQLMDQGVVGSVQDPDGDGRSNFLEFAFGTNPNRSDFKEGGPEIKLLENEEEEYALIEFTRSGFASGLAFSLGASIDLTEGSWAQVLEAEIDAAPPVLLSDGRVRESWRITTPVSDLVERYFRLEVVSP